MDCAVTSRRVCVFCPARIARTIAPVKRMGFSAMILCLS
jgi:hypothetical protein